MNTRHWHLVLPWLLLFLVGCGAVRRDGVWRYTLVNEEGYYSSHVVNVTANGDKLVLRFPSGVVIVEEAEEGLYRSRDGKRTLHWEQSIDAAFYSKGDEVVVLSRR